MESGKNSQAIIIIFLVLILIAVLGGVVWFNLGLTKSTENENKTNLSYESEIEKLKLQLNQKEQELLQFKENDENKEDIDSKTKEKDEKITSLEKANKEQKATIDKLNKELTSIKSGITKRIKVNSYDWRRASGNALLGTFRFDTLDNVEKIEVTFSDGYEKIDAMDVSNDKKQIIMSLDKSKNTGTTTVDLLGYSDGNIHVNLEVYYTDGRSETVIKHLAMG